MIEATCSACGTQNRIAESDVPSGAKFVTCASCKSRVALPASATKAAAIPGMPKPGLIPAIPAIKSPGIPRPPVGAPSIPLGPAGAKATPVPVPPIAAQNEIIDLSDLPAPKRQSPLGAPPEAKPAPKSGLAAALDADLPAPKAKAYAPLTSPGTLDLDDLMSPGDAAPDLVDLPAPKAAPRPTASRATPTLDLDAGFADLPAPKAKPVAARGPAPQSLDLDFELDLPAPKPGGRDVSDLPAPKAGARDIMDLPTPKPGARDIMDLPTPKPGARDIMDLPMPKPGGITDLPTPARPQQAKPGNALDLPAPKGFFDDLPQPAKKSSQAPEVNDIAPKGFFDDLPQPAKKSSQPAPTNDIAPKGFFDDLPQPAKKSSQAPATNDIAPKGFFDDLPQPALAPRTKAPSIGNIDLGEDAIEAIDLADESGGPALQLDEPALDLPELGPALEPESRGSFDDLDLSAPSAAQGARAAAMPQEAPDDERGGIRFGTPKKTDAAAKPERAALPSLGRPGASNDDALELEEPRDTQSISQKLGPRARPSQAEKPAKKPVNRKLIGAIVLGLAVVGAGGAMFYKRHAAAQARTASIEDNLLAARTALASDSPRRWELAAKKSMAVLEIDANNAAAHGIAAEATFASALADGKNLDQKFQRGQKLISDALGAGQTGPEIERAQALSAIKANPAVSVTKLQAQIQKAPKDSVLSLYLAWAHERTGKLEDAIKAYDVAAAAPSTKIIALLGRAKAKLDLANVEGARADYDAVLAVEKDNIPAQVGLASALPASQSQQQESDLLAILARKDIGAADPRAVSRAWTLAGDAARRSNRRDAARDRYRKALAIDAIDIGAITSLAEVELADGKIQPATEQVEAALLQNKDFAPALVVKAEIAIAEKKLADADPILSALEAHDPPLPTMSRVRVGVVRGKWLEASGKADAAVDAYIAAAKLAGELDLTPTMAAISKLTEMAKAASLAKDAEKEASLKARADELLGLLAEAAAKDPSLAFTLGIAYQQAGEPAQAEPWLTKVVAARPNDPDAIYQLGKVLRALGRSAQSIDQLEKAFRVAPDRLEIGVELAQTFEALDKKDKAGELYAQLLTRPEATVELRTHAGMFFLHNDKPERAGEQGKAIVDVDPTNAAGHYLLGEGYLASNKLEEARKEFTQAINGESTAIYNDGLGRAWEALSIAKRDLAAQDNAIRSYNAAIVLDPTLFTSQLGLGRLYVARNEMQKAVIALIEANKLKANDAAVAYNMGAAYAALGEKKVALQWLVKSSNLKAVADTYYKLGEIYSDAAVDNGKAAESAYQSATNLARDTEKATGELPKWYAEALFQLGSRADENGNRAGARAAYEKWLATDAAKQGNADRRREVERKLTTNLRE